jgi:hypothetical protein
LRLQSKCRIAIRFIGNNIQCNLLIGFDDFQ